MRGILTRAERRQMERAKEKRVSKLMAGGYNEWKDVTDEPHTQAVLARADYSELPFKIWMNGMFVVQAFNTPNAWGAIRVMIRWNDCRPDHDWSLFQRIKNELFGPERVALEVFPAESNKQDVANIYWFWVLPEDFECPIEIKRKRELISQRGK